MSSSPFTGNSDLFDYDLSSDSEERLTAPPPQHLQSSATQQLPPPPRLPSPHIFSDIFSRTGAPRSTPRQAQAQFRQSFVDVSRALEEANQAIQNAGHALQSRAVVDLTSSPPTANGVADVTAEDTSHTRLIGQPRARTRERHRARSSPPLLLHPMAHNLLPPLVRWPGEVSNNESSRREENRAIRQQQEARAHWERRQLRDRNMQRPAAPPPLSPPLPTASSSSPVHGTSTGLQPPSEIESVDLTQVDDNSALASALAKQRSDAVKAQQTSDSSMIARSPLTAYKCPICMDTPKDATTTICGHLFCHRCIIDTLKWSEQQRTQDLARKSDGVCPVCRKIVKRKDKQSDRGRSLIPLAVKLTTKSDLIKGKQRADFKAAAVNPTATSQKKKRKREESELSDTLWREFVDQDYNDWVS